MTLKSPWLKVCSILFLAVVGGKVGQAFAEGTPLVGGLLNGLLYFLILAVIGGLLVWADYIWRKKKGLKA